MSFKSPVVGWQVHQLLVVLVQWQLGHPRVARMLGYESGGMAMRSNSNGSGNGSRRPENGSPSEGIVHGHIHNYNNMTYIHGHIHQNVSNGKEGSDNGRVNGASELQGESAVDNASAALDMKHADCRHFEFFDFHNNNNNDISSTFNNMIASSTKRNNAGFHDSFSSKYDGSNKIRKLNNNVIQDNSNTGSTDDIESDENYARIFEICCDVQHSETTSQYQTHSQSQSESVPMKPQSSQLQKVEPATPSMKHNRNNLTCNASSAWEYNDDLLKYNNNPNSISSNNATFDNQDIRQLLDLNCSFSCNLDCDNVKDPDYSSPNTDSISEETKKSITNDSDDIIDDNDDFFDRYCQLCEINEKHKQHIYDAHHKTDSMTMTPSSSINDSNNRHNSNDNNNDDNNKHGMEMKILEDLCNISSLYEVPMANHMSHHHHAHPDDITKINGRDNDGRYTNGSINLLQPIVESRDKNKNNNNNTFQEISNNIKTDENINSISNHSDHQFHHHHKIHLHTNIPDQKPIIDKSNNGSDFYKAILNNAVNFSVDAPIAEVDPNGASKSTNDNNNNVIIKKEEIGTNNNILSNTEEAIPPEELNTIDFNWTFKRDNTQDLRCQWNNCTHSDGFDNLIDLQKHMYIEHIPRDPATRDSTHGDSYDCDWKDCNFSGSDVCSLVNHINDFHGINFGIKVLEPEPREYYCQWDQCSEKFDSPQGLNDHLETCHLSKGKSQYECQWKGCNKKFHQRQKIVRHLKVHSGYKPFKCNSCGKTFSSNEILKQHMRTHSGEKPYKCDICGKGFAVSSSLKVHRRTHTGEKPLQCDICGKKFNESSNLNKHKKTHFKEFQCGNCHKRFSTLKRLQVHEAHGCQ